MTTSFTAIVICECLSACMNVVRRQIDNVEVLAETGKMTYCEKKTTLIHLNNVLADLNAEKAKLCK